MKKMQLLLLILIVAHLSCEPGEEFELPEVKEPSEIEVEGRLTSIAAVKGNFDMNTGEIHSFYGTNTFMEGYLVSSDQGGNFYKKLVLQDRPSNPTAGIQVLVDDNSLYQSFNFGRKVMVKLDGLSLGFSNGVLQLGIQNRGDVVAVPPSLIDEHLIRTTEVAEIVPLKLEILNFSEEFKNLYVQLDKVQLNRNLVREDELFSFASNVVDQYDGVRQLESCVSGATTILSTSTFADFRSLLLPQGSGSITGILTRNFYDDQYVVIVNSPEALEMNGPRCDPEFLECGDNSVDGPQILFEETFTNLTTVTKLTSGGWINLNVNGGAKRFEPGSRNGDRYWRISAYNTTESPLEAWLISPEVDLRNSTQEVLSFDIMASYDNSTILEVLITENYTGNPLTTDWELLKAEIPLGPGNANGIGYKRSKIDISCLQGEVRFAFRYLGSAPDKSTTYDIDNILVTGF